VEEKYFLSEKQQKKITERMKKTVKKGLGFVPNFVDDKSSDVSTLGTKTHRSTDTLVKDTKKMVYLANTNANMQDRLQERKETWTLTNNKGDFGIVEEPRMKELTTGQMQGYRVYDPNGIGQTLQANCGGVGAKNGLTIDQCRIRRLTPKECERLQGFKDDHTKGVSDTQRYKQCSNAIMVDMAYKVAKQLE